MDALVVIRVKFHVYARITPYYGRVGRDCLHLYGSDYSSMAISSDKAKRRYFHVFIFGGGWRCF